MGTDSVGKGLLVGFLLILLVVGAWADRTSEAELGGHGDQSERLTTRQLRLAQLGPRPFFLIDAMQPGPLKEMLTACKNGPFYSTAFSIGHRGAPLQFPEHTKESYEAAATMGAGILECDVTFTKDRQLVCRHSQCDLHTTTNILATPLAAKCSKPFIPADTSKGTPALAKCCTSDITLAEFRTLQGKMDASNPAATTIDEFMQATSSWRTDLYNSRGTLMSHKDSIALFKKLGTRFSPELKAPAVTMPFDGEFTQQAYAQLLIDEYREAGIDPSNVWVQSFNLDDVLYWIHSEPQFGRQAVYLDDIGDPSEYPSQSDLESLVQQGVRIIAPPIWALVDLNSRNRIVASPYAHRARSAGLEIITWTLERSGPLTSGGGWYYQTVNPAINSEGDVFEVLHVLARDVGVLGVFSDWPATVTYYANCIR